MKMRNLLIAATFLASLGAAFAASGTWSGAYSPSSFEVTTNHNTSSPYSEVNPVAFVVLNGSYYAFQINGEKEKLWADMIRTAMETGEQIAVYYDTDNRLTWGLCPEYNSSNACTGTTTSHTDRVLRVSLQ